MVKVEAICLYELATQGYSIANIRLEAWTKLFQLHLDINIISVGSFIYVSGNMQCGNYTSYLVVEEYY
jgi:hypothetical protein